MPSCHSRDTGHMGVLVVPVDAAGFLVGLRELLQVKQACGEPVLVLPL